jgi:hypothetical protein
VRDPADRHCDETLRCLDVHVKRTCCQPLAPPRLLTTKVEHSMLASMTAAASMDAHACILQFQPSLCMCLLVCVCVCACVGASVSVSLCVLVCVSLMTHAVTRAAACRLGLQHVHYTRLCHVASHALPCTSMWHTPGSGRFIACICNCGVHAAYWGASRIAAINNPCVLRAAPCNTESVAFRSANSVEGCLCSAA